LSRQRTIEREVEITGRGLFTGHPVTLRFKPAPPGAGITFVRCDQGMPVRIGANIAHLTKRARRTSLKNGAASVETVEHCLAALRGLELDNVDIELDNVELPAGDGSARTFLDALVEAGAVEQEHERRVFDVRQPVRVAEGEAELVAWPGRPGQLDVIYELDYGPESPIGRQLFTCTIEPGFFREQVAPARTFVTEQEAAQLRAAGLGTHLSYQDIVVVGPDGPVQNEYRYADECVRHKVLDLVGDLMLFGGFVCGRVYARRSGHHLNHELVRLLQEQQTAAQTAARLAGPPKLDIRSVQRVLPHRYPMLLVDRVVEIDGDRRAVGIKNVTINEPFFLGHYPRQPIMPGVLIIEAMAQLGGILLSQKLEHTGKVAVLLSLDKVKFRRPVVPGDQLILEAHAVRVKSRSGEVFCQARVGAEEVAEAAIRFMLVDADPV
jgi:UDP-3-O-[3-hydroxymyristoyl] N-acetylglucosamine deacetylase/3-hydroxyacyl-[acyl-carrier-protein] dehydratase